MREITGNLWDYHAGTPTRERLELVSESYKEKGWLVITTNGTIKRNGNAVMGRGVAYQAANRFPKLPLELGEKLIEGNLVYSFPKYLLLTMPVKHHWAYQADPNLIVESAVQLAKLFPSGLDTCIYMPRPGCGNGGLLWKDVKPLIKDILNDNFCVVEISKNKE